MNYIYNHKPLKIYWKPLLDIFLFGSKKNINYQIKLTLNLHSSYQSLFYSRSVRSFGELSIGKMSFRGIACSGNCPSENCPSGNCPSGKCLRGIVRRAKVRRGNIRRGTVRIPNGRG